MAPPAPSERSATTERAVAFVAARRADAEQRGRDLAEHVTDPETFTAQLRRTFDALADPEYLAGQQHVAPGIGALFGVRWPLHAAVVRGFRAATRHDTSSNLLFVVDRLFREPELELRWFGFAVLERTLPHDPERSWQLLRRAAHEAADWITVDSLAHPYGRGILLERHRWAEIEQLIYAPSRWERRLVGSTLATIPHVDRRAGRAPEVVDRGLWVLAQLIGDDEPDVQKALAWAYRTFAQLDLEATTGALEREAAQAAATNDGHRAWVVRDSLSKLEPASAERLRDQLAGIRRRPGVPSTSIAAETAARFADLGLGRDLPEPPLT